MNDVIRLAAERAAEQFNVQGKFNAAGFSREFIKMSPTSEQLDGHVVRLMLTGRNDIKVLSSGVHYQIISSDPRGETVKAMPSRDCKGAREMTGEKMQMTRIVLQWDENNLGRQWMNPDNLRLLLYSKESTKPELLEIITYEDLPCGGSTAR